MGLWVLKSAWRCDEDDVVMVNCVDSGELHVVDILCDLSGAVRSALGPPCGSQEWRTARSPMFTRWLRSS